MTNPETDRRAQWATALWEAAEQNTIAEWICCDPIDPKHGLCVAGGKALEMLRALIVDDPEAYKPAPLTTVALELAAVSVPPPAPRADDQAAAPADWIDGHPQLEAIAAAVWEQCEHHDSGLIIDDPRNIAVAAYAAVLAVLPEPADRAAVLREAAAAVDNPALASAANEIDAAFMNARTVMATKLRRLADEAQQPEPGPCVAGEQQNETPEAETPTAKTCPHNHTWPDRSVCLPPCSGMHDRCVDCETAVDDCPNDAAGVRQDGAQPQEPPVVAYRSDGGRLLNCLRHVPPPAARHADFHPVTAEDLPDGGICTYPDCGVDVLAEPHP